MKPKDSRRELTNIVFNQSNAQPRRRLTTITTGTLLGSLPIVSLVLVGFFHLSFLENGLSAVGHFGIAATIVLAIAGMLGWLWHTKLAANHSVTFDTSTLLMTAVNTMVDGLFICDLSRQVVFANPPTTEMLGIREGQALDDYWRQNAFFVEQDGQEAPLDPNDLPSSRALRGETSSSFVLGVRGLGSSAERFIESSASPLRDAHGTIVGAMAILNDITERRRLWSTQSLLASVVEASADAIVSTTVDGQITSWNPAAARLFEISATEAIGRSRMSLVPPARVAEVGELSARLRQGETVRDFETQRLRKDGSEFSILLSIAPISSSSGRVLGYSEVICDISDRKREQEMRKARDLAEESVRVRAQFLANMSHEIRTPLNPVLGMAQLLLLTRLDSRQREYVETIRSSGELLRRTVDDILDFSKFAAGKLALDVCDFDLVATVEDAVDSMAARADAKHLELGLSIDPDVPRFMRGDPSRLRQVINNLVSNAIKFTAHGEVIVTVSSLESSAAGAMLEFYVKDTGIGISAEAQQQLFQPFTQADASTARKFGGTGLGLAICRQLVERMAGTIGFESAAGAGSRFHFTARFATPQETARPFDAGRMGLAGIRVLVVDDNPTLGAILKDQLSAWNVQPTYAENGAAGLAALRKAADAGQGFHVALIDLGMPGMDGRELAHAIRSEYRFGATRLALIVTSTFDSSTIRIPAEVDALVHKPFRRMRLIETLCSLAVVDNPNCVSSHGASGSSYPAQDEPAPVSRAAWQAKVLVVDDDHVNQTLALNQLAYLEYEAEAVDGGGAALQALDKSSYDLILMDCQMPIMDGYQTATSIRLKEAHQRHTPMIAMTANAMEGDRDKCLAAGMDDYLSKPVDLNALAAKLRQWLSRAIPPIDDGPRDESPVTNFHGIDAKVIADAWELSGKVGYDVLRKTAEVFFADAPKHIADLEVAIAVHDLARTAQIAHQLKGAAGCVGISMVRELCAEVEASSKEGRSDGSEELVHKIETEIARAREVLLVDHHGLPDLAEATHQDQRVNGSLRS